MAIAQVQPLQSAPLIANNNKSVGVSPAAVSTTVAAAASHNTSNTIANSIDSAAVEKSSKNSGTKTTGKVSAEAPPFEPSSSGVVDAREQPSDSAVVDFSESRKKDKKTTTCPPTAANITATTAQMTANASGSTWIAVPPTKVRSIL